MVEDDDAFEASLETGYDPGSEGLDSSDTVEITYGPSYIRKSTLLTRVWIQQVLPFHGTAGSREQHLGKRVASQHADKSIKHGRKDLKAGADCLANELIEANQVNIRNGKAYMD